MGYKSRVWKACLETYFMELILGHIMGSLAMADVEVHSFIFWDSTNKLPFKALTLHILHFSSAHMLFYHYWRGLQKVMETKHI